MQFLSSTLKKAAIFCLVVFSSLTVFGQNENASAKSKDIYTQIRNFSLTGGSANVSGLVLKRDRVTMTFSGTFYFAAPVEGKVTGAVFIGGGSMHADMPPSEFEKNNVKRLLDADVVQSDFKTAVLRFTDDTFDLIGQNKTAGPANSQAQKLVQDSEERMIRETGANLSSRLALSLVNGENPGFFFATFDGGRLDRFSFALDYQTRIPTNYFNINAGEKGLIFSYKSELYSYETWLAFYSLEDYKTGSVSYSDMNDLVDVTNYKMTVDLRTPKNKFGVRTTVSMNVLGANVKAIPFNIGEELGEGYNYRLKKQMKLKAVRMGAVELSAVQEDWESSFLIFLPEPVRAGQKLELEFELGGDFLEQPDFLDGNCSYPSSTTTWYPRHGYLDRSTYDFTYLHNKKNKIASVGTRQSEQPDPENSDNMITKYLVKYPVALVTFAMGPFERHQEVIKWDKEQTTTPIEFNSLSGRYIALKEDFVLAELNNSVRYFHALFGTYPYENFGATFHPYGYGQGLATMLLIPATDHSGKYTYSFIAHETAHQWWGNIVAWRSYRDQWLSEGFAEYSGVLYSALRQDPGAGKTLVDEMRQSLKGPPRTRFFIGKGRLNDVGPIILGYRLNTSKTPGTAQTLIYSKGALVLRMLHFLFTSPANGDDKAFFDMMKAFVEKFRNSTASTDDFRLVANQHFAKTPIAQKYRLTDLNWFFRQWVYQTDLPSYQLNYSIQDQPDGSVVVSGTVLQENAPANWFMPLPLVFTFGGNKFAAGTVAALGPSTPFSIKLPSRPSKVELDPHKWVLSEKTSTN